MFFICFRGAFSPSFFLLNIFLYLYNMEQYKVDIHIEESKYEYEKKIKELENKVEQLKKQIR